MSKKPIPTKSQARQLARLWGTNETVPVGGYDTPTTRALVKHGWITPNGITDVFPNGTPYRCFAISADGTEALLSYLLHQHHKRA